MLDKKRLQELVKEVDPNEQLDEDVEELLLHIADDFIEQVGCCLEAVCFLYIGNLWRQSFQVPSTE